MSLRTELRDAIDEVTPPAPTLESQVTTFVLKHDRRRATTVVHGHSRSLWTKPFRGTLTMVAAALIVVLIGALVLGGRYLRDMSAPPQTISQTELKSLEGRPLQFPVVGPGSPCPASPIALRDPGVVIGDGPFYMASADTWVSTDMGRWVAIQFDYDVRKNGLVLIRIKDLQSAQTTVVFAQYPLGPSGVIAAGSVLGTDHALDRTLQLRREALVQDPSHTKPINAQGWLPPLKVMLGLPKTGSGCVGFQIDGPGFSENFVIDAQATLGR